MIKPFLSLCMIVKNEEANLARCLSSVQAWVDEIIIVDTGSTDSTIKIAESFHARIFHFDWCNDFAAARNISVQEARGEWVFIIDADEELKVTDPAWLDVIRNSDSTCYQYCIRLQDAQRPDQTTHLTDWWLNRIGRNVPGICYQGRFHEQLIHPRPFRTGFIEGAYIYHHGSPTQAEIRQKMERRNIPILEAMRQDGSISLMLLVTLAENYDACNLPTQAQECWQAAQARITPYLVSGELPPETSFLRQLLFVLAWGALEESDYNQAKLLIQNGIRWFPQYAPLIYLAGLLVFYLGFYLGAIPYFEKCLSLGKDKAYDRQEPFNQAFLYAHPAFSLGYCWMKLGNRKQAQTYFKLTLTFDPDHEPAQTQLKTLT